MTIPAHVRVLLVSAGLCAAGCSGEAKKSEPTIAPGSKQPDPRLKLEQSGGTAAPQGQGSVKGD